jgi:hypothetical protein
MRALGAEVNYTDFADYCRSEYGFETVPRSQFFAAKKEYREALDAGEIVEDNTIDEPVPASVQRHAEPEPSDSALIRVIDLPDLLGQARALLDRFGGDKDALAKFLRAL